MEKLTTKQRGDAADVAQAYQRSSMLERREAAERAAQGANHKIVRDDG